MSVLSGKCDLLDSLEIDASHKGLKDISEIDYSKYRVGIYGKDSRIHEIKFDNVQDAMKYAPYIIAVACGSDGRYRLILSSMDYITEEENERLDWELNDIKKIRRQLKRKHIEVTAENIKQKMWYRCSETQDELIKRVLEHGDKANHEDIHLPIHEHFRNAWYTSLLEVGMSKYEAYTWVYGFRRTFNNESIE